MAPEIRKRPFPIAASVSCIYLSLPCGR